MNKFAIKADVFFIFLFILVLSFFTVFRIKNDYALTPLAITNKNLLVVRESIDEFHDIYKKYPNEEEIKGSDDDKLFLAVLKHNIHGEFNFFKKFEFPKTSYYTKKVDGISVAIGESSNIKIANKIEALGLDNSLYTSNGGWIYSPTNGEFRANLQSGEAKNKLEDPSRPEWARTTDWYYR